MKLAVGVAVLLLLPSAAFAQGNPGPFGGLFGRTPERIGRDYTIFEIRTSTGLQFDDQTLNLGGVADQDRGRIAGLTGAALFDHNSTRLQTKLRSRVSYHQFLQTQVGATTVENSGAVTWRVGTRLSVDASGSYIYSPYLQFFPNLVTPPYTPSVVPPSLPYTTGLVESDTAEATVGFTSHYSKQSTFSAMVSRRQTQFRAVDDADYESNSGRVLWTRRTGRNLGVRLG